MVLIGGNSMDECPNCNTHTFVYHPKGEVNTCSTCGYVKKETYEHYIKRKDCAKDLLYPRSLTNKEIRRRLDKVYEEGKKPKKSVMHPNGGIR